MKKILTTLFAFFLINTSFSQCIEDVRALIDEFIEFQSLDFITSNGKGYVGRGYFLSGGSQVYFFSVASGLLTTPQSNGQPIAVSENGNYVLLSVPSGNWNRWETATGNILPMPFPANLSGYNVVGVANGGSVFANLVNTQNQVRGYFWTPSNGWQTAGETALNLSGISNDGSTRVGIVNNQPVIWKASTGVWETMEGFDNVSVRINDISGNGLYTTGYFWDSNNDIFAYRWSNGNVEIMPGSDPDDEGLFVTDNGSILAYERRPPGYTSKYVWWSGSSVTNFYDILIQSGLHPNLIPVIFDDLLPDGSDGTVTLISDDGFAIAGYEGSFKRILRSTNNCTIGIAGKIYQYSVQGGNALEIHWSASGISGDVTLEWSADGNSFMFIDNAPAMHLNGEYTGHGWYSWNIPYINTDSAYIRITAPGAEEILGPINITSPLSFINPSAGDLLIAGETDTIKWAGVDSVNIYLSINYNNGNGEFSPVVENYFSDSGKYVWEIPDTLLSRKCVIMIEDASDPSVTVESGLFRIKPYVLTRINPVDSNYYEFKKNRDQWGFSNTLNDMWPPGWWLQFNYNGTDPFTNSQYSQWQVDETFKIANHATHSDWVSWVNTFSVDACYFSTTLGIYRSAAVLKWQSEWDTWGGSCFGIAAANALAFSYKEQFQNKYPNYPDFINPITVASDTGVKRVVNELYTHQYGNPSQANDVTGFTKTPNQTLNDIKQMLLEDECETRTITIFGGDSSGAHTILAYKVRQDPNQKNKYYIDVYDNSYPNSNNPITIDTSANGGHGIWSSPDWSGWNGKIYLEIKSEQYFNGATFSHVLNSQSPFIFSEIVFEINFPSNSPINIVDALGNVTGFQNNIVLNEIPGSLPLMIKNGSKTPPYGYSLPADNYSVILNEFEEDTVEAFFFTGNKSFLYERYAAEQNETDRLYLDGGVSVSNPDAQTKTIKLLNIINEATQEKLTVVRQFELTLNDSVKIENPDSNKVKLISYGSAKDYDIELNYVTENGVGRFGDFNIQLTANTSHTFVPVWTGLTNSQLVVLVDVGNNGTIDDTLYLNNAVDVEDEGSLLVPDKYNLAQNYPNPFNPVTTISYSIPKQNHVSLKVYDILGNEVATLINEDKVKGVYSVTFDASNLASGIYLYRIQAGSFVETKKMILLR